MQGIEVPSRRVSARLPVPWPRPWASDRNGRGGPPARPRHRVGRVQGNGSAVFGLGLVGLPRTGQDLTEPEVVGGILRARRHGEASQLQGPLVVLNTKRLLDSYPRNGAAHFA